MEVETKLHLWEKEKFSFGKQYEFIGIIYYYPSVVYFFNTFIKHSNSEFIKLDIESKTNYLSYVIK